ncbi:MAG: hypothetical protein NTW87_05090 [Planctomycetota bacterium]|nr:hypothetical protein [Planctomycetota bacterium]
MRLTILYRQVSLWLVFLLALSPWADRNVGPTAVAGEGPAAPAAEKTYVVVVSDAYLVPTIRVHGPNISFAVSHI